MAVLIVFVCIGAWEDPVTVCLFGSVFLLVRVLGLCFGFVFLVCMFDLAWCVFDLVWCVLV